MRKPGSSKKFEVLQWANCNCTTWICHECRYITMTVSLVNAKWYYVTLLQWPKTDRWNTYLGGGILRTLSSIYDGAYDERTAKICYTILQKCTSSCVREGVCIRWGTRLCLRLFNWWFKGGFTLSGMKAKCCGDNTFFTLAHAPPFSVCKYSRNVDSA